MSRKNSSIIAVLLIVLLILCVIPICQVAQYAHPLYDDYRYSAEIYRAIQDDANCFEIIKTACSVVKNTYYDWQGTYSAVFLFTLQPGVFSQKSYCITVFLLLGMLAASLFFLADTIFRHWLGRHWSLSIIVWGITLFCCIEFVPYLQSAFFWYNGGIYYTGFFSIACIYFGLLILLLLHLNHSRPPLMLFFMIMLIGIIIGGGNYTTGLVCCELMVLISAIWIGKKRNNAFYLVLLSIVLIGSFTISVFAPGNRVRAALTPNMDALHACLNACYMAVVFLGEWFRAPQIVYLICISIIAYKVSPSFIQRMRCPLLVMVVTFFLFASQMVPPMYGLSSIGAGRQINIYYYSAYLMIAFDIFYLMGWVMQTAPTLINDFELSNLEREKGAQFVGILFGLMFISIVQFGLYDISSCVALKSVTSGQAEKYDHEYMAIVDVLESDEKELVIQDIENTGKILWGLGLSQNPDEGNNGALAKYYSKNSVRLK